MSKRARKTIPKELANQLLFDAQMTCCICREHSKSVQLHHIDKNSSNNREENLVVLCVDCHNKAHSKSGFARTLTPEIIIQFKNQWLNDTKIWRQRAANFSDFENKKNDDEVSLYTENADGNFCKLFIMQLPDIREKSLAELDSKLNEGTTFDHIMASREYTGLMIELAILLIRWIHPSCFNGQTSKEYIYEQFEMRRKWGAMLSHPHGIDRSGTIRHIILGGYLMFQIDILIEDMVVALLEYDQEFNLSQWQEKWRPTRP